MLSLLVKIFLKSIRVELRAGELAMLDGIASRRLAAHGSRVAGQAREPAA